MISIPTRLRQLIVPIACLSAIGILPTNSYGLSITIRLLGSCPSDDCDTSGTPTTPELELPENPLQLLYNQSTGNLFLDRPDVDDQTDYSGIMIAAPTNSLLSAERIALSNSALQIFEASLLLPLTTNGPDSELYAEVPYTIYNIAWDYRLPNVASDNPIYVGRLIEPWTEIEELLFSFGVRGFYAVNGNIVLIPEPTAAALLLTCLVPAVIRRRI